MGWFKKLKKKLTMKNLLKGAKSSLKLIPGGGIIAQGIGVAEKAFKEAGKVFGKTPEQKGIRATQTAESSLNLEKAKSTNNTLLLLGVGVIAYFVLFKGK